jgi:Flp pilus assembly protein CpaB
MYWMSGIPPQVIAQARQQADADTYRLRVGIWRGHPLGELAATDAGRAYLRSLLPRPSAAVSAELRAAICAVLGLNGSG